MDATTPWPMTHPGRSPITSRQFASTSRQFASTSWQFASTSRQFASTSRQFASTSRQFENPAGEIRQNSANGESNGYERVDNGSIEHGAQDRRRMD